MLCEATFSYPFQKMEIKLLENSWFYLSNYKSAFSDLLVCALEDAEQNGEKLALKMQLLSLVQTKNINRLA